MTKPKIVLGIETSCDETAAAVCVKDDNRVKILSNIVASSADLHAKYGGIIPEQAAREQLKSIIPVVREALFVAFPNLPAIRRQLPSIDAIAVTHGPGLIGSLLVGVETAKTLALVWNKPLAPINHLVSHFYANWIIKPPAFPCLGLLVSGGHTDLVLFKNHGKIRYLGGTRDDAAGECFDKCARLLGLGYPGGPAIAAMATTVKLNAQNSKLKIKLPRPMIDSGDFDFSFSGLKTAVLNLTNTKNNHQLPIANLAFAIEEAITDVLVEKTIKAAQKLKVQQIMVAGGVAANQKLKQKFLLKMAKINSRAQIFIPPPYLCTDNAVCVATAAFFNFHPIDPLKLQADPGLPLINLNS